MTRPAPSFLVLLALAGCHRTTSAPPDPGPGEPGEPELREACVPDQPEACMALAWYLQSGEWGRPRWDESYDLLKETCSVRAPDACGMAVLMADAHPDVARDGELDTLLEVACTGGNIPACFRLRERLAETDPDRGEEALKRACAHQSVQACAVTQGEWPGGLPAAVPLPTDFYAALSEGGMEFRLPAGFEAVPVRENPHLAYQYAIRSMDGTLEVRYRVYPLEPFFDDYDACVHRDGCSMVHPDDLGRGVFLVNVANVADETGPPHMFPPLGVRLEFGAHWGAVAWFQPRSTFADGFSDGLMIALHRDGRADAAVVALFQDVDAASVAWEAAFHALRFAEPVGL